MAENRTDAGDLQRELEQARKDPLDSPALATAANDLIEPCPTRDPLPARPPAAAGTPLALAFSGGGFRATLAALGVLRFLADTGMLRRSATLVGLGRLDRKRALRAPLQPSSRQRNFTPDALDEIVIEPLIERISEQSLSRELIRNGWRIIGRKTRTASARRLLRPLVLRWAEVATAPRRLPLHLQRGQPVDRRPFRLRTRRLRRLRRGPATHEGSDLRLATAVAASAAVPGAFAPLVLDDFEFPCSRGRVAKLVDGGAYDNAGLEPVDNLPEAFLVALNAGGLFQTGGVGGLPVVRN